MNIKVFKKKTIRNGRFTKVICDVELRGIPDILDSNFMNLDDRFSEYKLNRIWNKGYFNLYYQVSGTSMCSEDDEFDEHFGIDLAENRAELKAYSVGRRIITATIEDASKQIAKINNFKEDVLDEKYINMCQILAV